MGLIRKLKESKHPIKDIISYIQGNIRYRLYYSNFKFLIRKHIQEQIDFRIQVMDRECYNNGSCKICGCETTALQMANKACDKPCYPRMYSKKVWKTIGYVYQTLWDKDKKKYYELVNYVNQCGKNFKNN